MNGFGMAEIKEEGGPVNPDELTFEHDLDKCEVCRSNYKAQLRAYQEYKQRKAQP